MRQGIGKLIELFSRDDFSDIIVEKGEKEWELKFPDLYYQTGNVIHMVLT